MPTKRGGYFLSDGTKVPSVTTVIGRFRDSGGLIHWAWEQGKEGRDFNAMREAAADAGTVAHAMVEADIRGRTFADVWAEQHDGQPTQRIPDAIYERGFQAYGAFLEWRRQTKMEPRETEVPLVSERFRYGGTLDAMLIDQALYLGDWKTSNAIYGDHLLQLAAYGNLWRENRPEQPIAGFQLLRFSKENGDFSHHYYGDLTLEFQQFLLFRKAYDNDKIIKRRAK